MNEVKRFIRYLIENDLAFTHIDEAVKLFRNSEDESDSEISETCSHEVWPPKENGVRKDLPDGMGSTTGATQYVVTVGAVYEQYPVIP